MSEELGVVKTLKQFIKECDNDVLGLARNVYETDLKEVEALQRKLKLAEKALEKIIEHNRCGNDCETYACCCEVELQDIAIETLAKIKETK